MFYLLLLLLPGMLLYRLLLLLLLLRGLAVSWRQRRYRPVANTTCRQPGASCCRCLDRVGLLTILRCMWS